VPPLERLDGQRALVMGLGRFGGGRGAARHLLARGAQVLVTDLREASVFPEVSRELEEGGVELVLGRHRRKDFEEAEIVVANPAVSPDNEFLTVARAAGARITSEIELFLEAVEARLICVTGTQGKSSTCHALASLLESSGFRVHLGGNIGGSLLETLDEIEREDVVVLEISSYQLAALGEGKNLGRCVEVVAITNLLSDHLERHGDLAGYARAKARILELVGESGTALLPAGDDRFSPPAGRSVEHGAGARSWPRLVLGREGFLLHPTPDHTESLGRLEDLGLPGAFQRENVLLALGAARLLGADPARLTAAVSSLRGLDHRLQDLGLVAGRRVFDNGVSTTPDSTISALLSLRPACTLLAGGRAKRLPLEELAIRAAERCARVITFGEARDLFAEPLERAGVRVFRAETLEGAVEEAFARTREGDEILFSPAASSFDAFGNFQERADAFRRALEGRSGSGPGVRGGTGSQGEGKEARRTASPEL
jgi:UDP-N-acetylmuramoylalanine--D-glutamate ligase